MKHGTGCGLLEVEEIGQGRPAFSLQQVVQVEDIATARGGVEIQYRILVGRSAGAGIGKTPGEGVGTEPTQQLVVAGAAEDAIVATATVEVIAAGTTDEQVIATQAENLVVGRGSDQRIGIVAAGQGHTGGRSQVDVQNSGGDVAVGIG